MEHYDAKNSECFVYTYKEGLLSGVAHDLKIRVGTFTIDFDADAGTVKASFDPSSLRVVAAMHDGQEAPRALGDGDKAKIEKSTVEDVLRVKRFPEVKFNASRVRSEEGAVTAEGELSLAGVTQPMTVVAKSTGETIQARVTLNQPAYGIKPFSAMLGALKIKPDVTVEWKAKRAV